MKKMITLLLCGAIGTVSPLYPSTLLAPPGAGDAGIPIIRTPKKLIIFDVGNVCAIFDFSKAAKKLGKYTKKSEKEIIDYLRITHKPFRRQELGEISTMAFYNQFMKDFDCSVELNYTAFTEIITGIFQQIIPVMALMDYLLENGYNVSILSSAGQVFKQFHIATHPVIRRINYETLYLTSSDINLFKSEPKSFKYLLQDQGVPAPEAVFIDDIKAYTDVAEQVGISGIHFKGNVNDLIIQLIDLGVSIDRTELLSHTLNYISASIKGVNTKRDNQLAYNLVSFKSFMKETDNENIDPIAEKFKADEDKINKTAENEIKEIEAEILRLLQEGEIILGLQGVFSLILHGYFDHALSVMAELRIYILQLSKFRGKSTAYSDMIKKQLATLPEELNDMIHAVCEKKPDDAARITKICVDTFDVPSAATILIEKVARSILELRGTDEYLMLLAVLQNKKEGKKNLSIYAIKVQLFKKAESDAKHFDPSASIITVLPKANGVFSIQVSQ